MTKNELIEALKKIEGNPVVLLEDSELGYTVLKKIKMKDSHQYNDDPDYYVDDDSYSISEYYHDNCKEEKVGTVVLTVSPV